MKLITFNRSLFFLFALSFLSCNSTTTEEKNPSESVEQDSQHSKFKALIMDGENNHGIWPKTTMMLKNYLEETGLFEVEIKRKKYLYQGPHHAAVPGIEDIKELLKVYPLNDSKTYTSVEEPKMDSTYLVDFSTFDLVVSNMGWKSSELPLSTQKSLEKYVEKGGGLVIIHAANNAWPEWKSFNEMNGLGGWGERSEKDGPYVYYNDKDQLIKDPSVGQCGSHGPEMEFKIKSRAMDHPIMKGLPKEWLHAKDELYDRLRGPAENMTVLATAYSDVEGNGPPWDKETKGSGRHEPMLFTVNYGKGRMFHSTLGHMDYSMECVGFMSTFQRGAEWAASGKVSQEIPDDFPSAEQVSTRKWKQ